jgi:hypothetical protein
MDALIRQHDATGCFPIIRDDSERPLSNMQTGESWPSAVFGGDRR